MSRTTRHGQYQSAEYRAWLSMITRCENRKCKKYPSYGGRGIVVCREWRQSFERFFADLGCRPSPRHSLDRIDVNGSYEPGNVRWATSEEQNCNRRDNVRLIYRGAETTLSQALRLKAANVSRSQVKRRLAAGWDAEAALDTPTKEYRRGQCL